MLHAIPANLSRLLGVFGRHGVPGEDVEEFMRQVEVAAANDFMSIDQHHIQFRQAARGARNALECIHHEHEDAEFPLHDLDKARRRHVAKPELGDKALSGLHGVFEALMACDSQGSAQKWRGPADLRRNRAEGRDPPPGVSLVGVQPLRPYVRLTPGEPALADKQEWIGEIVERCAEFLDGDHQLLGRDSAFAGLDRRNRLAVLEAEQAREVVLRQLSLFAQRLDPRSDQIGCHGSLRRGGIILRNANCKIILRSATRIRPATQERIGARRWTHMASKPQHPGLDGRSRDKDGEIRHKNGNTRVDTLRETYGDNFAPDVRGDMHLDTLLDRTGAKSLSELVKSKKE